MATNIRTDYGFQGWLGFAGLLPLLIASSDAPSGIALGLLFLVAFSVSSSVALLAPLTLGREAAFLFSLLSAALAVSIGSSVIRIVSPDLFESSFRSMFIVAFMAPVLVAGRAPTSEYERQRAWENLAYGLGYSLAIMAFGLAREFLASGTVSVSKHVAQGGETLVAIIARPEGAFILLGLVAAAFKAIVAAVKKAA